MFKWFDVDASKEIDMGEFKERLGVLDIELEKREMQMLFNNFDLNRRGVITLSNFEGAFAKYKKALEDKQVPEIGKIGSSFGGKGGPGSMKGGGRYS